MENKKQLREISITGVLIQDEATGGYTSYFAEFPEVIAEGDNRDAAVNNLFDALLIMLQYRKSESHEEMVEGKVLTESFQLSVR